MKKSILIAAVALSIVLVSGGVASAGLILDIQRVSDTEVIINGSGTVDSRPASRGPRFRIRDLFATPASGSGALSDNSFVFTPVGGTPSGAPYTENIGSWANCLRMDLTGWPDAGDVLTGSVRVTMADGVFAPVGATGDVGAGNNNSAVVYFLGTYEVTAAPAAEPPIPEPAGIGLIGIALLALRKKRC